MSGDRFVWPPRPLDDGVVGGRDPSPSRPRVAYPELAPLGAGRLDRLRRAWRQVEATWLGHAAAPLADRAAAADWRPDGPEDYCPRCASTVGFGEVSGGACPACRRRALPWLRAVRLGEHTGLLRELIHEAKFTAWRQLGMDLGRLLGRSLAAALDQAGVDQSGTVLVPMPTTYQRRMARGIDHARVIARGVREVTGIPLVRALDRSHRRSQLTVPVSRRAANIAGSMRPIPGFDLRGLTVVVVDDVRTTGATMAAACRAVAECKGSGSGRVKGPAGVWAAVLAVALEPGRRRGRGDSASGAG